MAANFFDKKENCLKKSDIKSIESHFLQFKMFTKGSSDDVCIGKGIDRESFEIVRTVLAIKSISSESVYERDVDDDFTLRPIKEKNWWKYLTDRSNRFILNPSYCNNDPSWIAYVNNGIRGAINLCPPFFKKDAADQIAIMLHEVRHFDGHDHVTCTQGEGNGVRSACDNNIQDGGSYAVEVQVLVKLSELKELTKEDRALSESSAIYQVNNRFNSRPRVKVSDYIYLSNSQGEIHRASLDNLSRPVHVATLNSPAKVFSYLDNQFTIFPLDTSEDAYRVTSDLKSKKSSIGLLARQYNKDNKNERLHYSGVNYGGYIGILKNDVFYTWSCEDKEFTESVAYRFNVGNLISIFNFKDGTTEDETFILSETGDVYSVKCDEVISKIVLSKKDYTLPTDIVSGFSIQQDSAFILNQRGELLNLNLKTKEISPTSLPTGDWISATPLRRYKIFESVNP